MLRYSSSMMMIAVAVMMSTSGVVGQMTMMTPAAAPPYSDMVPDQAPAPGGVDCFTQLLNMSDCLTYVESGSKLRKPDKPCCPELAGLVESYPMCLCQLLTVNASSYGFDIDKTRALNLPSVCSVSTPPVSLCSMINGSPAGAPSSTSEGGGAPLGSPSGMMGGGGGGSESESPANSPSSGESGSGGGPSGGTSPTLLALVVFPHYVFLTTAAITAFLLL